ncbi:MAG: hypothetical protein EXX96DRAFT_149390 [Benjaminiella poitrasii]|nr:MAG: hypothetical protein EXX96DRAFT_149390 [Benjaminiella poitrasii]
MNIEKKIYIYILVLIPLSCINITKSVLNEAISKVIVLHLLSFSVEFLQVINIVSFLNIWRVVYIYSIKV